ncbi:MAG: hypothetical protein IT292_04680 [Deltaproteobacteria bacterium]|nr:hypothetical protein [Deltaproteobacteria bacterium]
MSPTIKKITWLLLFLAAVIFYRLLLVYPTADYDSFIGLNWEQGARPERRECYFQGDAIIAQEFCRSSSFKLTRNIIEFVYKSRADFKLQVKSKDGEQIAQFIVPLSIVNEEQKKYFIPFQFTVSPEHIGKDVYIQVSAASAVFQQLTVKRRLNFFRAAAGDAWVQPLKGGRLVICVLLGAALALFILKCGPYLTKTANFALLVLALSALVHFKMPLSFYADEWNILIKSVDEGWRMIFQSHNEHFIPLFFALYFIQLKVFGSWYLGYSLVTYLLFMLSVLSLDKFLAALFYKNSNTITRRMLLLFFAISCLQAEVLQWPFVQCLLLMQVFVLWGFCFGLQYLRENKSLALIKANILLLLACLSFGNGLAAFALVGLVCILELAINGHFNRRAVLRLGIISMLAAVLVLVLYMFTEVLQAPSAQATMASEFSTGKIVRRFLAYLFIGSQLGTILRGLGLFPFLSLYAPNELLNAVPFIRYFPEITLALCGLLVSLLAMGLTFKTKKNNRSVIGVYLISQAWLIISLLLPAIGRWIYCYQQSLSLRYQHLAFVGICIFAYYIISDAKLKNALARKCLTVILALHLASQFWAVSNDLDFQSRASINLNYLKEVAQWSEILKQERISTYEAKQTHYNQLYPEKPLYFGAGLSGKELIPYLFP